MRQLIYFLLAFCFAALMGATRFADITESDAAREILDRKAARASFLSFIEYTKPDYRTSWHHRYLAQRLDAFARGEIKRLMVFMPPQHGKSEQVSRRLPAYILGRNPAARVLASSYAASLANSMNRDVQRVMDSREYASLFPRSVLSRGATDGAKRTESYFQMVGYYGSYRSAGAGAGIAGHGFDIGIIDDPFSGVDDAESPTVREKIWQWYNNDFYTRRGTQAGILITQTRWHRDDLAGRLLRQQADPRADQWEVICFPAIKEDDSNPDDPRKIGDPLWPEFMPLSELKKIQAGSPRTYHALYQQNPRADGGTEWQDECFGEFLWVNSIPKTDLKIVTLDPSKGGESKAHDYSALVFLGATQDLNYVEADLQRRNPTQIVKDLFTFCDKWQPDYIGIEGNAFQDLLLPMIESESKQRNRQGSWVTTMLCKGDPIHAIINRKKKELRIRRLSQYIVPRRLRFLRSPGCQLLIEQLRDFPHADHDDGPDALEMAVRLPIEIAGGEA